jgi:hypothetical protein
MPWQADLFDVLGEYEIVDGEMIPCYREVFFTTPRQSGKTAVLLSWAWERLINWPSPQRVAWTGQTGKDVRDKWLQELYPQIENSKLMPAVKALTRGMGNEHMESKNGSRIDLIGSSITAGHGGTRHAAVMDEIFGDKDRRREQMLIPSMSTIDNAQTLVCSTAGDAESLIYNSKRRLGRQAVVDGQDHGLCYVEYSAPDGWEEDDEDSYWTFMPALGLNISMAAVRHARQTLAEDPGEFRRAYGNLSNISKGSAVIPLESWAICADPKAAPSDGLAIGVDIAHDRGSGAVAIADSSGAVELVDFRQGTGWIAARANQLAQDHGAPIFVDGRGPIRSILGDLEKVRDLPPLEVVQACGALLIRVTDRRMRVRNDPDLDAAVEGLVRKDVGDNFVWSRKASVADVTPLYAATLALWGATGHGDDEEPYAMSFTINR